MRAEASAAASSGLFGILLTGACALTIGLVSRTLALDSVIYFATLAGVLLPASMVISGGLARWTAQGFDIFTEREVGRNDALLSSLAAGLVTAGGGLALILLTAACLNGFEGFGKFIGTLGMPGYIEIMVLILSYVALSIIGGVLYGIVIPRKPFSI